jgi:hypothetical protein
MFLFWILFGALIGVAAAHRRGFGTAAGVIGGMLLGPLAILMFLADGGRRQCPQCAEWIQKQAKICPHCKSDLTLRPLSPATDPVGTGSAMDEVRALMSRWNSLDSKSRIDQTRLVLSRANPTQVAPVSDAACWKALYDYAKQGGAG